MISSQSAGFAFLVDRKLLLCSMTSSQSTGFAFLFFIGEVIMSNQNNKDNMETVAMRVCIVSIFGNTILSLIKLLAGVIAHSGAMVSDAVHSASDVFSSIIVIVGVKLSAQASDKEHPYGHERLECIAALLLANILCLTGIGIGYGAVKNIIAGDYAHLQRVDQPEAELKLVARALLPADIYEDCELHYAMMQYSMK